MRQEGCGGGGRGGWTPNQKLERAHQKKELKTILAGKNARCHKCNEKERFMQVN